MKYKCLVFDHDDTVVNSTATIHHPCFEEYLRLYHPGMTCTLENYLLRNFSPGFLQMCHEDYNLSDEELVFEGEFWKEYVLDHIPVAYDGIAEIMRMHKEQGGIICVVSHSMDRYIYRDYEKNGLPRPDAVYGWEHPAEHRKPNPFPLTDIMERFGLTPADLLMIDDLKPGYDMAKSVGVDFAAVGWSNDLEPIENFMRLNSQYYFKSVDELRSFLFA